MSNAAATIPAKRNVYRAKTSRIPSLDDDKQQKRTKDTRKRNAHLKHSQADVLEIKHRHSCKTNNDNDEANGRHFDENQETWITKSEDVSKSGPIKMDPSSVVKERRFLSKTSANDANKIQTDTKKSTIKILHVQQYDKLMEERSELRTLNEKYIQRTAELEQENARVLAEFSQLYEDHERLSRKMDIGKDPLIEPYSRVFEDRKILRDAEDGYKKRILRLELEVNEKQGDYDKLQDALKRLKAKWKPNTETIVNALKQKEAKMEKEITKLQKENVTLRSKVEELEALSKDIVKEKVIYKGITYKKPKPVPIKVTRPLRVMFAKEKTENNDYNTTEEKREKFDYEYYLPDSLVESI